MSPLSTPPLTATGAARTSWPKDRFAAAVNRGGSAPTASPQHLERPFEILAPQATPLAHDPLGASAEPPSPDPVGLAPEVVRSP